MKVPDLFVGKRLFVGEGLPTSLGIGPAEVRGSAYIEGPAIIGDPQQFSRVEATLMVGPNVNVESTPPMIAGGFCYGPPSNPFSLAIDGPSAFFGKVETNDDVIVGRHLATQGDIISNCGGHILSAKKNFDIQHPTKDGWRLRHTCPEGPSNDVYIRGKVVGINEIELPEYWSNLVDPDSITVSLTPIGQHQDVIVKEIEDNKIILQSKGDVTINCYYHIFAERMDGEKLIPEYQGESPADYPGNNDEYSVSGYHYDIKE
jgi:hypothetical protein